MNKLITIFIAILLIATPALAADVDFTINGLSPGQQLNLEPNEEVTFETNIGTGVYVNKVEAIAENKLIQELLNEYLNTFLGVYGGVNGKTISETFILPAVLPAGAHDIKVAIHYEDDESNQRVIREVVNTNVEGDFLSKLAGFASGLVDEDTANELIDYFMNRQLKRLPRTLEEYELVQADLAALGITKAEVNNLQVKKVASQPAKAPGQGVEGVDTSSVEAKPKEASISQSLDVFELTNPATGATTYQSKVILGLTNEKSLNRVETIVEVPKEIAELASLIQFNVQPEVLVEDPIVKWNFNHIPEGQTKDYSFTVNQKLDSVESVGVLSGGNEPGLKTRFIMWLVKGGWVFALTAMILLAFISGGILFYRRKGSNKKEAKKE